FLWRQGGGFFRDRLAVLQDLFLIRSDSARSCDSVRRTGFITGWPQKLDVSLYYDGANIRRISSCIRICPIAQRQPGLEPNRAWTDSLSVCLALQGSAKTLRDQCARYS